MIESMRLPSEEALRSNPPFTLVYNAEYCSVPTCYLICRHMSPRVVLETEVDYGAISASILKAFHGNRQRILHRVDLPPLYHKDDQCS